ncbi:MAG: hypothetical protein OXE77_10155 [Flavobacteriaceae bacterium]|nr:hypothetical protein [Flavobacteriaceae bacterium]MCY4267968.1 hypothetical protein [Flavobacteriaceae bacterium]MCY4299611.1 hypothetical protein [Flavobacteriaceae bacterium]
MKKSLFLTAFLLLISNTTFAQIGGIEDSVNDVSDTITELPLFLNFSSVSIDHDRAPAFGYK